MERNLVVPPETRMADVARMAHNQGCKLMGRPGRLSMERAIDGMSRCMTLIEAGSYDDAITVLHAARRDAFGGQGGDPCAA